MSPGEGSLKRVLQDGHSRGEAGRLLELGGVRGWHESGQRKSQVARWVRIWMQSLGSCKDGDEDSLGPVRAKTSSGAPDRESRSQRGH